jgi:DNA polymerase-3 subunit delta'
LSFSHLIGNKRVKEAIHRFLSAGRVPNALLFAGPEGVGKKQFSLELARLLVCQKPIENEACGECASCRRVTGFVFPGPSAEGKEYDTVFFSEHPDVGMVVPFNRTLRVESIRALEREANFQPFEASARIFIIDDAHKMNASSSNALLKTLEEPPPTSHIFLITSKPDVLLPTIRSRSQVLRFGRVDSSEIEHMLLTSHDHSQDDARLIAEYANGNVAWAASVDVDEFRRHLDLAIDLLRSAVLDQDIASVLKRAEKIHEARNGIDFERFMDVFEILIHRIWTSRLEPDHVPDQTAELAAVADPDKLSAWIQEIEDIRSSLSVNINKKIATDALLVGMAAN